MKKKTDSMKFTAEGEKMAGRSVILKKLCELESELAGVISDPTSPGTHLQIPFDEIQQRFVFLGNLIQQEMASGQHRDPDELKEIKRRSTALHERFLRWYESRHSVCSDCTQNLLRGEDKKLPGEMKLLRDAWTQVVENEIIDSKRDASTQVVPCDDDILQSGSDTSTLSSGGFSGKEEKPDKLLNCVENKNNVRKASNFSLGEFSGEEEKPDKLLNCVENKNNVRKASNFSLGEFSGEEEKPGKLLNCVENKNNVRKASTFSLGEFSGEEEKPDELLNCVENKNNARKETAAVVVKEENLCGKLAKYSGVFGCGMIIGAICMAMFIISSYSGDTFIGYEALLLPPT